MQDNHPLVQEAKKLNNQGITFLRLNWTPQITILLQAQQKTFETKETTNK